MIIHSKAGQRFDIQALHQLTGEKDEFKKERKEGRIKKEWDGMKEERDGIEGRRAGMEDG